MISNTCSTLWFTSCAGCVKLQITLSLETVKANELKINHENSSGENAGEQRQCPVYEGDHILQLVLLINLKIKV